MDNFAYLKTYVVGVHWNRFAKAILMSTHNICFCGELMKIGPRQANLVLIAYASSEGSGEPAHPRSLARTFAARSYKQWIKRNLQTESQIPGPSEWLGMHSWNLSWRNARRHKFAWGGSISLELSSDTHLTCSADTMSRVAAKPIKSGHFWHKVALGFCSFRHLANTD